MGGHREQIASGLETEETVGNTLTQQRPEAHLLLNKKKETMLPPEGVAG